jgi:hypothetical protein
VKAVETVMAALCADHVAAQSASAKIRMKKALASHHPTCSYLNKA